MTFFVLNCSYNIVIGTPFSLTYNADTNTDYSYLKKKKKSEAIFKTRTVRQVSIINKVLLS